MAKSRQDPKELESQLKFELSSRGLATAEELCAALKISQPSLSRLLKLAGAEIAIIREGRVPHYAIKRRIFKGRFELPVYLVSEFGEAEHVANLLPIGERAIHVQSVNPQIKTATYPDIPYWLDDLRPSGYLGRLIPQIHQEFAADIITWSADTCLKYWHQYGADLVGNIIVGEPAFETFVKLNAAGQAVIKEGEEAVVYNSISNNVLAFGDAGSSAGGEQPKFIVTKETGGIRALVKFSPSEAGEVSIRRRDLLICEALAHEFLRSIGKTAPISKLFLTDTRTFLEIERFDRKNKNGRIGVISLRALAEYHMASVGSWKDLAAGLVDIGVIKKDIGDEILWRYYFGEYIANSDMHNGNLSFFCAGEKLLGLTPIYDMLPMRHAPLNEEVIARTFSPKIAPPNDRAIANAAAAAAVQYWKLVTSDTKVSAKFRAIAAENVGVITTSFSQAY